MLLTSADPSHSGRGTEALALYIHWPFCVSKCPYCDFNSHVRAHIDEAAWRDALLADLAAEARITPGRRVHSIFFGGGTPSLMAPATVGAIIDAAAKLWGVDETCEITLEANPSSVEAARFAGFASAGVGRVSLGLQALDDAALKVLGRPHDVAQGLAALDIAQANFARVSFDLIYDRPAHTVEAWSAELARALSFGTEHLSLYQLTIEAGTRFAVEHAAGRLRTPDAETSADLFDLTQDMTEAANLPAYETSNHGVPSRHNLSYWTYGDYVGVGPGAHGRREGVATVRHKKPENWLAAIARGDAIAEIQDLPPATRATEALLMGLRLTQGIDRAAFARRTGIALADAVDGAAVTRLAGLGLIVSDPNGLRLTRAGRPLVNAVLREIA